MGGAGIYEERERSREEIFAKVAAGELTWDLAGIEAVSPSWGEQGHGAFAQEGQELEAAAKDDEISALLEEGAEEDGGETEEERQLEAQERAEEKRQRMSVAGGLPPHEVAGTLVPASAGDTEADVAAAIRFVEKRRVLEQLQTLAAAKELLPMRAFAEKKLKDLVHRSQRPVAERHASNIITRLLAAEREAAAEAGAKIRRRNAKLKRRIAWQKARNAELKGIELAARQEKKAAEKAAEEVLAKAKVPQEFGAGALGQGKKNGGGPHERQKRLEFLDRMRYLYPLPADVEAYWEEFRAWWPAWVGQERGKTVGSELVAKMKEWKASGKDHNLFATWVQEQQVHCPAKPKAVAPKKVKKKAALKPEATFVKM